MKTKRWTLMAATGVTVLVSSMAFAAGSNTGSAVGTDTLGVKSTTNATVGADTSGTGGTTSGANAGTSAGANAGSNLSTTTPATPAGGMSSSQMSTEGAANTNGPNSADRDKGTARAEDRAELSGKTSSHTRTSTKHHKVAKPAASDASGS